LFSNLQWKAKGGQEESDAGIMEWWNIGKMEYWSIGVMEYWKDGMMGKEKSLPASPFDRLRTTRFTKGRRSEGRMVEARREETSQSEATRTKAGSCRVALGRRGA
jgi:hypothetical protein